jgi:hypothetical protein
MGIRFFCQHCQRPLNVKTVQAGQAGECPHCQLNIVVPRSSDTRATHGTGNADSMTTEPDVDNQVTQIGLGHSSGLDPAIPGDKFSVPMVGTMPSRRSMRYSAKEASSDSFLLDKPQPSATLGKVDPIEEAPRKVWYFRSKNIGEKGPLRARAMREELDNGNCRIGCIVWREDWEDWQPAEKVFPELVALAEKTVAQKLIRDANAAIPDELNPDSAFQRRRRRRRAIGMLAIAVGLTTIGVLAYYLRYLLSK